MKFGIRTPSLKKRISAKTSWKRIVRHRMRLKAPRGMGILTNPKKAVYNKVYNKTSISVDRLLTPSSSTLNSSKNSCIYSLFFIWEKVYNIVSKGNTLYENEY